LAAMFGHRQVALALLNAGAHVSWKNEEVPYFIELSLSVN